MIVAALFVATDGVYFGLPGVDPWDEARDARRYAGPHAVVAHPPCQRWGRYWHGSPSKPHRFALGDDGGCFAAALFSVRAWGGVLEHPEGSQAWRVHGLTTPPRDGGWIPAGDGVGATCCVDQGHYGHRAKKMTWLYAVGCALPELRWGRSTPAPSVNSTPQAPRAGIRESRRGILERMSHRQRIATPAAFRDLLIGIARTAVRP